MTVAEQVFEHAKLLPESPVREALDFVRFCASARNAASGAI
jgi:hypothetical protein